MKRFRVCGHWLSRVSGSARLRGLAAFGVVAALVVLAIHGLALTLAALHGDPAMPAAQRASAAQHSAAERAVQGRVLDSFFQEQLRTERFWRNLKTDSGSSRQRQEERWSPRPRDGYSGLRSWNRDHDDDDDDDDEDDEDRSANYRTVCVRLCDGYYWPMSFATSPQSFAGDAVACQRSCNSPARLFVYRNPGQDPEQMVDLSGRPYARLDTAFRYRTTYDAACQCRPEPWSQEAQDRHRMYALQAERRKGNRTVDQEIAALKAKQTAARQAAAVERHTETRSDGEPIMRLGVQPSGEVRRRRSRSSVSD